VLLVLVIEVAISLVLIFRTWRMAGNTQLSFQSDLHRTGSRNQISGGKVLPQGVKRFRVLLIG
jgi:hypothetical protein